MPAKADTTLGLDFIFSGSTPPGNPAPWGTATFADVPGGVQLTLANNLSGTEFFGAWYFNLDPAKNASSLNFALQPGGTGTVTVDGINKGTDAFKADGDGFFDVVIEFGQSGEGRYGAGDSLIYLITGIPGLTAADFNHASSSGGGTGVYFSAAHLQSLAGGQSDWIGDGDGGGGPGGGPVPEPSTYLVLGSFVAMALYLKRRMEAGNLAVAKI